MRLKSVTIGQYKNLRDFTLGFDGNSFIDVFVGKNATGKSNLFEALIEVFRHLYEYDKDKTTHIPDYTLCYEIDGSETEIIWRENQFTINGELIKTKSLGAVSMPENVLVYYSGHNDTVKNLVRRYEDGFRKRIRDAEPKEARRFIGIGPEYKELLLAVLLLQRNGSKARQYVCNKLGIESVAPEIQVSLKRPGFADGRLRILNVDKIDHLEPQTHFWGAEGNTREFLGKLMNCIKGEFAHRDVYDEENDCYRLFVSIDLFQKSFSQEDVAGHFRQFDNLRVLGMLDEISVSLQLAGGVDANTAHFSDGQFQSVYIYSIIEVFKDRNCITLLDEPDCFLHPEWQFEFLKQVFEITDATHQNNHVLMSSHSASTITTADDSMIRLFDFDGNNVAVTGVKKADVIKSLSAGLITFSESEARLSIQQALNDTSRPVLFTEGITDEMILETAWSKLYPTKQRLFEIQYTFGSPFLRCLMKEKALYENHPDRTFFSLFDFDKAYNDWKQLGQCVQTDPHQCLVKKHTIHKSYAILLPVPTDGQMYRQVINPHDGSNYGERSLLTMELLFYGIDGLDKFFAVDTKRTDGFFRFVSESKKTAFAQEIVPSLDCEHFDVFRPLFDFIQAECEISAGTCNGN